MLSADTAATANSRAASDSATDITANTGCTSAAAVSPERRAHSANSPSRSAKDRIELSAVFIDAISGHRSFHTMFTIPATGDADVDAYMARVEALHTAALSNVNVPVLAMLAEVSIIYNWDSNRC